MESMSSPPSATSNAKRQRRHSPVEFDVQTTTTTAEQPMSPSSSLSGGDATFEPTIDMMVNDFDDEQTLNEEESLANLEALNPEDEIATLKEESEMPLSELLAKYGALPPPPPIDSEFSSTRKKRRRRSINIRKSEETTKDERVEDTIVEVQPSPSQEQSSEELNNVNSCLETDEVNHKEHQHTKPDLNINYVEEEMTLSTSEQVTTAEIARHQEDITNSQRSHLFDLYPDACFDESKTKTYDQNSDDDLPLEMLYGDVDDEDEEDDDIDADDLRKTIMIGSSYQADIPDGLSQYGDDVLPYENEDKLIWEPCQVSEHEVEDYLLKVNEIIKSAPDDEGLPLALADEGEPKDTEDPTCSDQVHMEKLITPKSNESQIDVKLSLNTNNTETDSTVPSIVKDNEQALHLLVQCGYDFKEALRRKRLNVLPLSDCMSSWSEDECQKFEEGIQKFGKDFLGIRQHLVRTRTMREMVQFYYLWKKSERRDQSCANADTIDQMDVYLNESGGDIVGSSIAIPNGSNDLSSTTNSISETIETKKLQAKNYSIMMIGNPNQSNNSSIAIETSEVVSTTTTSPLTLPLSPPNCSRKRIAEEQDNSSPCDIKNDSSN